MQLLSGKRSSVSKLDPSGVCGERVGCNSIQCTKCVRPVLLYCCEKWEFTVADEARLRGVEGRMVRMVCWVILVDRVSTDVLRDMVGVVVKIEDMIIQSHLR